MSKDWEQAPKRTVEDRLRAVEKALRAVLSRFGAAVKHSRTQIHYKYRFTFYAAGIALAVLVLAGAIVLAAVVRPVWVTLIFLLVPIGLLTAVWPNPWDDYAVCRCDDCKTAAKGLR